MVMKKIWIHCIFLGIAPLAFLISRLLFLFPEFVEYTYSRSIYPALSEFFGYIPSILSMSVGEIFLYFFIGLVIFMFLYSFIAFLKPKGLRLESFVHRIINFFMCFALIYTFFVFGWGINFSRMSLADSMGYDQREYSVQELTELTEVLAEMTNEARANVIQTSEGTFSLSQSKRAVITSASAVYAANARGFMNLAIQTNVKPVAVDNFLSNFRIQGICSPFTYEANVNMEMPDLFLPSTALHEYAHVQGFAREDECEFIAFYVGYNCGVPDYEYSTLNMALNYAMIALSDEDYDAYVAIYETLHEGIINDWAQHREYWEQFETPVAEVAEQVNDTYLKFNNQSDGTKSYGRMIDLMLAMYSAGEIKN